MPLPPGRAKTIAKNSTPTTRASKTQAKSPVRLRFASQCSIFAASDAQSGNGARSGTPGPQNGQEIQYPTSEHACLVAGSAHGARRMLQIIQFSEHARFRPSSPGRMGRSRGTCISQNADVAPLPPRPNKNYCRTQHSNDSGSQSPSKITGLATIC